MCCQTQKEAWAALVIQVATKTGGIDMKEVMDVIFSIIAIFSFVYILIMNFKYMRDISTMSDKIAIMEFLLISLIDNKDKEEKKEAE